MNHGIKRPHIALVVQAWSWTISNAECNINWCWCAASSFYRKKKKTIKNFRTRLIYWTQSTIYPLKEKKNEIGNCRRVELRLTRKEKNETHSRRSANFSFVDWDVVFANYHKTGSRRHTFLFCCVGFGDHRFE